MIDNPILALTEIKRASPKGTWEWKPNDYFRFNRLVNNFYKSVREQREVLVKDKLVELGSEKLSKITLITQEPQFICKDDEGSVWYQEIIVLGRTNEVKKYCGKDGQYDIEALMQIFPYHTIEFEINLGPELVEGLVRDGMVKA